MKTDLKKIRECKMRLSVVIDAKQVESRYQEVLRGLQSQATLAGFRQGKAPLDLVEKKFVKEVHEEVLRSLIPEAYHEAVLKHEIAPVSLPSISPAKIKRGRELSFEATFETEPVFSLKNYKGIKIKKIPAKVHPEDLEKGFSSLLESKAELVPILEPRAVQKGDFIVSDIEVWQNDRYIPGKKGVLLAAWPNNSDDFYDKIIGAQLNEVREISVEQKPFFKVWVRQIQEKKLPTLDDVFAGQFGKKTVEELKGALQNDLSRHKISEAHRLMKDELYAQLLRLSNFGLPEGLVVKQQDRLLEQARNEYRRAGMPEARFEADKSRLSEEILVKARDQVKLYYILKKVADHEKIETDEIELERRLAAINEESKRPLDEVRRVFEEDLRESMREKQTVDFLLAHAKLED